MVKVFIDGKEFNGVIRFESDSPVDPPTPGKWTPVEPIERVDFEDGQIQLLFPAQPDARFMRVRFTWTPWVLGDEYEPFALVGRRGKRPIWPDLPFYFVLRGGNARFRTGVGVPMDAKATREKKWRPGLDVPNLVESIISVGGAASLIVSHSGSHSAWSVDRPEGGAPGPWPFDLMLQLGGPAGKSAGHTFEDVVLEVM